MILTGLSQRRGQIPSTSEHCVGKQEVERKSCDACCYSCCFVQQAVCVCVCVWGNDPHTHFCLSHFEYDREGVRSEHVSASTTVLVRRRWFAARFAASTWDACVFACYFSRMCAAVWMWVGYVWGCGGKLDSHSEVGAERVEIQFKLRTKKSKSLVSEEREMWILTSVSFGWEDTKRRRKTIRDVR